jgi:hypothetical protein
MTDRRECGGCYQPVRECECETEDERWRSRQSTQFDPNEEAQARIEELERRCQDEEGCRAKACAEAEGYKVRVDELEHLLLQANTARLSVAVVEAFAAGERAGRCAVPDPDSALSDKLPEISGAEPILVESSLQSARPGDRFLRRQAGDRPLTADSSLRMVKCRDKWIVVGDSGGLLLERGAYSSWRVVLNLSTGRLELLNASEKVYTTCTAEMVG